MYLYLKTKKARLLHLASKQLCFMAYYSVNLNDNNGDASAISNAVLV